MDDVSEIRERRENSSTLAEARKQLDFDLACNPSELGYLPLEAMLEVALFLNIQKSTFTVWPHSTTSSVSPRPASIRSKSAWEKACHIEGGHTLSMRGKETKHRGRRNDGTIENSISIRWLALVAVPWAPCDRSRSQSRSKSRPPLELMGSLRRTKSKKKKRPGRTLRAPIRRATLQPSSDSGTGAATFA